MPAQTKQSKKSPRYQTSTSSHAKGQKYSDAQSRKMMTTMAKRKIISERQIKLKEYEEAGIVQLLKD